MAKLGLLLERAGPAQLWALSVHGRVVGVALDVLPQDLANAAPGVAVVDARGVAAGTQTLDEIEAAIADQVSRADGGGVVLLHSLSDVILCAGKSEALRFIRRLASRITTTAATATAATAATAAKATAGDWTLVCVVHEALHSDRDVNFWKDAADYIYSTDALTGVTKQHAAKKNAVSFKPAASATGSAKSTANAVPAPAPPPPPPTSSFGSSNAVINSSNPEDFEDEDDDPDDDLDL